MAEDNRNKNNNHVKELQVVAGSVRNLMAQWGAGGGGQQRSKGGTGGSLNSSKHKRSNNDDISGGDVYDAVVADEKRRKTLLSSSRKPSGRTMTTEQQQQQSSLPGAVSAASAAPPSSRILASENKNGDDDENLNTSYSSIKSNELPTSGTVRESLKLWGGMEQREIAKAHKSNQNYEVEEVSSKGSTQRKRFVSDSERTNESEGGGSTSGSVNDRWQHLLERQQRISSSNINDDEGADATNLEEMMMNVSSSSIKSHELPTAGTVRESMKRWTNQADAGGVGTKATSSAKTTSNTKVVKTDEVSLKSNRSGTVNSNSSNKNKDTTEEGTTTNSKRQRIVKEDTTTTPKKYPSIKSNELPTEGTVKDSMKRWGGTTTSSSSSSAAATHKKVDVVAANNDNEPTSTSSRGSSYVKQQHKQLPQQKTDQDDIVDDNNNNDDINIDKEMEYLSTNYPSVKSNELPTSGTVRQSLQIWKTTKPKNDDDDDEDDDNSSKRRRKTKVATKTEDRTSTGTVISSRSGSRRRDDDISNKSTSSSSRIRQEQQTKQQKQQQNRPPKPSSSFASYSPASKRKPVKMNEIEKEVTGGISLENRLQQWSNATNNAASAKASRSQTPLSPTQLGQKERTTAVATKSPQRPPLPFPTNNRSAAGAGPATAARDNSLDYSSHSLHDSISALTDDGTYADLTTTSIAAQSVPTTIIENSTTTVDYDTFIKMSVRDRLKAWSDQSKLRRKLLYSSRAMSPRDRKREIEGWMGTPQYTETIEKTNSIPTAAHLLQYDNASPADRRKLLETYELPLQSDDPIIQKDIIEFCTDFRSSFHQESNVIERNQILELYPDTVAIYYRGMVPNKLSEHEFWERFYYRCVLRTEKQRTVTIQAETKMVEKHEEQQQHEQSITPKHANTADSITETAKSSRVSPISSLAKSRASVKAKLKNWQDLTAQVMERHRSSTAAAATAARIELEETRQHMKDDPKLNYETAVTSNVGTNELNKEPVVIPQGLSVADRIVDYDDLGENNQPSLHNSASPNQEIPAEEQSTSIVQVSAASIVAKLVDADTNATEEDTSQSNSKEPVLSSIAAKRNDYWRNVSSQNQNSDNTAPRMELEETRKELSADRQRSKNDDSALKIIEVNDDQVERNLPPIAGVVKTSLDENDVTKRDKTTGKVGLEAQTYEDDTPIKESSSGVVTAKRLNWQNQFAADSNKDEYQNTEAKMELEKTRKQLEQRKSIAQESFPAVAAETQTNDIDAPKEEYQEARAGLVAAKRLHWQKQTSSDSNENDYRNTQAKMELEVTRKQLEERKSTSHEPIPEISAGILGQKQDTMVSSHRAEGNNELATITNSKISFDSSDDDEEMLEQTQASEEVHHGKKEYEHPVENQVEIKKDDVSNSILFDKPLESVPSPIHVETPKDEEQERGSDNKNIDDGSYSSSPEVPEEMNELGAVKDQVQAEGSEVTGEAQDELKTDTSKTSIDVHGVDDQSFYHTGAEDAEEMDALPVEDINESGTMAPEVTGEAHEKRKIESSKVSSVEVQDEDDQSSHPSSPEVLDKMDAIPGGEMTSIEESESNAESQDASMAKSIEAAAEVKSSIDAISNETASVEEQSDTGGLPREERNSSRVHVDERGEESSHADNDRFVPESNDDQDVPSSEVENEDEKLLEADATTVDEVGDDQILQSTSGPRKSSDEDAEVDHKEVLSPSEMDGEVSSLSSYEVDELEELFQMRADGEPYDETRLYELNQIVKYKSAHEEFNQDELAEFKTVAQKRRKQRKYRKEFEAILEKQDNGLEVDEDRLYCLELYAKEMVGEELSNSERLDLDEFLADEEPGEHKKEVKKSKATDRAAGSPEEAARARALALLARADGDERAETESVGSSSDTSHSGIQSGSSASDDVDHEIEEKGSMGDSEAGDENDGAVEDAISLPSDGPDDEGKSISDHKDAQESAGKDIVEDDVSEDAPLATENIEGFSGGKEIVGKDLASADANDELETSSTSEVLEIVHPADENVEALAFKTTVSGDSLAEARESIEDSALQDKLEDRGDNETVVQEGDAVAFGTEEKVDNSTGDSSIPDSVDESLGIVAASLVKEEVDQFVDEDEEGGGEHPVEEESVGDAKVSIIEKEVDQTADEISSDAMDARPVDESMGDSRASLAAQEVDQLVDDSNTSSDTQSVKESVGDANASLVPSEDGEEECHDGHSLEESLDDSEGSITEKVVDQPVDQISSPIDESIGDSRTSLSSQGVDQSVDDRSSHTRSMQESVGDANAPLAKEDEESNDGHSVEASVGDSRTSSTAQEVNQSVDDRISHTHSIQETVGDLNASSAKEEIDQSVEEGSSDIRNTDSVDQSVGDTKAPLAEKDDQSSDEGSDDGSDTHSVVQSMADAARSSTEEGVDESEDVGSVASSDAHSVNESVGDVATPSANEEADQSGDVESNEGYSVDEAVDDAKASLIENEVDQSVNKTSPDGSDAHSIDESVGNVDGPLKETEVDESIGEERSDAHSIDEGGSGASDTHSVASPMDEVDESMDERSTDAHSKVSRPDDDLAEGYSSEELLDAAREKGFEISVRTGNKIATAEEVRVFAEEEIQEARLKALDELDPEKREEELSRINAYEAAVKKTIEEKDRLFDEAERKAREKAEKERLAEGASRNNLDDEEIVVSDEGGGSRSEKPSSDEESSHESENDDESEDRYLPEDLEEDDTEKSHGMVQDGAEASEHETFDTSREENEDLNETNPEERADDASSVETEPEMSLEDDQSAKSIDQQDEAVKLKSTGDQDERSESGDMKQDLNSDHSEAANSKGRDDDSSSQKEISPISAGSGEPDEVPSDGAAEDDSESRESSSEKVGSHSDMDLENDQSKGDLDQQHEMAIPFSPSSDSEYDVGGADPAADADEDVSDVSHGVESHEPGDMPRADPTGGQSDSSFSSDSKKESVDASVDAHENSSTKSHDIENDEAKVDETSSHKSSPGDEDMENDASSSSGSKWDPPSPPNSPLSEEDDANASPWIRSPDKQPKSIEMPDTEPIFMDSNSQIQSHTMDDFAEADNVDDYYIPEDNSEFYEAESVQQDEPSRGSPAQSSVSSDDDEESSVDEDKESTKEDTVLDTDSENAEVGSVQSTSEAQESTTSGSDRENEEKGSVADEKETVKEVVINEREDDDASLGSVQSSEDSNEPDLEQENDTASKSSTSSSSSSSSGHSNDLEEPAENHGIKDDASDGSVQSAAESESQVNEELSKPSVGGKSDERRANEDQESTNSEQSHSRSLVVETSQASEDEESAVDQDASQHKENEESVGSDSDSVQSSAGSVSEATSHSSDSGQNEDRKSANSEQMHQMGQADEDEKSVVEQDDVKVGDASQHKEDDEESIGSDAASNDDVDSVKSSEVSFEEGAEKSSDSESTGDELEDDEEGSFIDNEMSNIEDAGNSAGDTEYLDRGSIQSSKESFFEGESTNSSGGKLEGEGEYSSVDQADVVKPDISDAENSDEGSAQSSEDIHESSSASSADDVEDEEKAASLDEKEINKEDTAEEGSVQSSENSFADVGTSSVASNDQGDAMAVSTDHETHSESEGSGARRSAAKKDSEHPSSHHDHSVDEGSDQESRSGVVNLFERAHPLPSPSPSTSSAENSKDSDGGASVSSEAKEVPQSSHDDVQKQEDFHLVDPSIEPTMSIEANDYHVLPEFWTEAVDEESGKKYYFNSLTQEVSWEVPSSNTGPEQPSAIEEAASDEREDSQNDNALDKDVATEPEQPSTIEEETALDERENPQNDHAKDKGIAKDDVEMPNYPNDKVLSKEKSPDAEKRLALPSNLDDWETGSDSSASADTNEINNIQKTKKKRSEKPTASGDYDWSTSSESSESSESSFEELVRIPNNKTKVAKKKPATEVVDATKALKSPVKKKKKKENDTLGSKSPVKSLPETPKKKKITKKKTGTLSVESGTGTPGKNLPDQESNIASEDSPGDGGTSEAIDAVAEGEAAAITAPETLKSPKKKKKEMTNKKVGKMSADGADVAASLSPGKKSPDNDSPDVDEGESAVIDVGSVASNQGEAKDGKGGKGPSSSVESHASSDGDWNKIDAGEAMPSEQDVETPSNTVSGESNEKNKGNRPIPFLAPSSKDALKNSERERVDSQTRQSSQNDEGPEQIAGDGPSDDLADVDDSFLFSPGKSPRKKRSPLKALSLMMKGKKKPLNEIDNGRPDSDGLTPAKDSDMMDLQKGADTYDDEEDAVNFDWSRESPSKPKANTNLFKKFAGLMRRKKKKEDVDDAVDDDAMKQNADTEVVDMENKSDVGSAEASEDSSDLDSPAETNSEPSEVEVKKLKKKKGTADATLKTPKKKSENKISEDLKTPKSKKKLAVLDSDDEQGTARKKKTKKAKSKKLDLSDSDDDESDAEGKRMSKSKSKKSKAKKNSKHKDINDPELSVSWERKKEKKNIDDESDAGGKRKSPKSKSKSSKSKKQSKKKDINDPDLSVRWERKKEKKTAKSKKDSKSEPKKPKSKKLIVSGTDDESDTARKKKSSKSKSSSKYSKKKHADEEGDEPLKKPKSSKKIKGKTEASFSDTIKSPKKPKSSKKIKDDSSGLDKLKSPKMPKKSKSKKASVAKDKGINEPDLSVTWERKKQSKSERKSAAEKEGDAVKKPKSSKGLSVEPKTPKKPKSSKKAISELKSPRKIQLDP